MKRTLTLTLALTALGIGLSLGTLSAANKSIVIKGSDTMAMVGQGWAEAYQKVNPAVDISVQGGGSGTGISALISGACDICQASRAMKSKEIDKCKERNILPVATTVALDGIAIAVNEDNPLKSITLDQIKMIYTGKVTNWKALGGKDQAIVTLSRENSSGTFAFMQEFVLENERFAPTVLMMPSTKAIQQELSGNPRAIGYGGEAYFKAKAGVKILPVALKSGSTPVMISDENIRAKKYPISRPLYLYTAGKPSGAIAAYIKFCLSADGQAIATKLGYTALK
jgi:phosphate transport system substrate-binding protein